MEKHNISTHMVYLTTCLVFNCSIINIFLFMDALYSVLYLLFSCLFSLALYRGVIRDFAVSLLASDLYPNMSLALDAAAEFTDEMLL